MAATIVSQSNTESVPNLAILRITTDAVAAVATTFQVGFLPRHVLFVNITDLLLDEWFDGMAADTALHTVAAGTRTLLGSGGITVGAVAGGGFVTLAAALIIASKTHTLYVEG